MRKFLLLVALFGASVGAFAQQEVGTLAWFPKLGFNLSKFGDGDVFYHGDGVGDELMKSKFSFGVVAGIEGEYRFSKTLGLSAGALYSLQGTKYDDVSGQKDNSIMMHYVNVPILLNVYLFKGFALKAGIQPGYAFNKKNSFKQLMADGWRDYATSGSDFGNIDFSIPVGLSYDFDKVRVDLRYNYGLIDLAKRDFMEAVHNRVIQLSVGYRLGGD